MEAIVEAVAARIGPRLSLRCLARRRRGNTHLPFLHAGKAAFQAEGGVRQGRDRGRGRPGSGEQLRRRRRAGAAADARPADLRSEEHTSELQSLMRISYAVFCLKKKKKKNTTT